MSAVSGDVFVSVAVAAAMLGVSESTVLRRARSGDLPAVVEDGRWRIPAVALPSPSEPAGDGDGPVAGWAAATAAAWADLPPLLTVEQVARLCGLGITAVRTAVRAGDFPTVRVGGRRLVPTAKLASMLGLTTVAA